MADTCIVCLNDLGGDAVSSPVAAESPPRPDNDNDNDDDAGANLTSLPQQSIETADADADGSTQQLARLVPCLHMFHNECLKPWVERANSCPVCRASFNVVELLDSVDGKLPILIMFVLYTNICCQAPSSLAMPSKIKSRSLR
jgi:hypothetical protein